MRRSNLFSYVFSLAITLITLFVSIYVCNMRYGGVMIEAVLKFIVGAIFAGLINAFCHELGHLFAGKKNGFALSEISVWFFNWKKVGKKLKFSIVMFGDQAGYTEMIPTTNDNLKKRYSNMTRGGLIASFIVMILGIPPFFMAFLPVWIYVLWVMFLPIGAYYFFGNLLPVSSFGIKNDGAVLSSMKREDDSAKVTLNLLAVQAELYNGKTPSEIDKSLYFDLPQLPEDDFTFAMLLNAQYAYYLDAQDFDNAKRTTKRLLSLEEYLPKSFMSVIKTDALYNACTFDFDEDEADSLMYELEKYLNNINTATNVRVKLAYLIGVAQESEGLDIFFEKGYKEADRIQIKGLSAFERKLLDRLKA